LLINYGGWVKMRRKIMDEELIKRIIEHKADLPKNYSVAALLGDAKESSLLTELQEKTKPKGVRARKSEINELLKDVTSTGFAVFNRDYKKNQGLVGAVIISYDERYDSAIVGKRLRTPSFDMENVNEENLDLESATISLAEVMPGEPAVEKIAGYLMNLAIVSAKENCFYDLTFPVWERSNLVKIANSYGFEGIGNEREALSNGDKILVLKKKIISPKDYVHALAEATGRQWLAKNYLNPESEKQRGPRSRSHA
jgi:hypothetical protein